MYEYIPRHIAPHAVEFYAKTMHGHRVIRVYLDHPTPRIMAQNEAPSGKTPAVLWLSEVLNLVERARQICKFGVVNEMITETAKVKSNKQLLGEASFSKYETVAEAEKDMGAEKLLDLLNAQVKTNAMNQLRAEKTGEPSVKQFRGEAYSQLLLENILQPLAGDIDALNNAVDKRVEELRKKHKEEAKNRPPVPATDESGEEDENDEE